MRESATAELVRAWGTRGYILYDAEGVKVSRESAGGRARKSIFYLLYQFYGQPEADSIAAAINLV